MVRIGILGCGRIGQVHARSIMQIPSAALVAVSDISREAADACAVRFGVEVREARGIVEAKDVDAVVIATPSSTHFDLIFAATQAQKPIFCEKPIDLSSERVRACLEAVQKAGIPFMTAFNQRFDPHFSDLERRVREGEIGEVETVTITSRDPAPPPISYLRTSGGIFRDMMIHDLDLARFLLKEDPVKVFAVGSVLVEPSIAEVGDVDTAAIILTTRSGKICQISNSRRSTYGYDQRIEVHGSRGMLRVKNVHESLVESATEGGFTMPVAQPFFLERFGAAYLAEMQHFVDALTAGQKVQPDANDGLKAQLIADAATLSWQQGQPVAIET